LGEAQTQEGRITVWIYTDTNKQFSDVDHLKVFESVDAANEWFKVNDPAGVAFEYEVLRQPQLAAATHPLPSHLSHRAG
jgi:hypothetical protein